MVRRFITISGTPNASGTFSYTIPLTGGCGTVDATGTITVDPDNTAGTPSSSPTLCINTALTDITIATTGATGIGSASGLPGGVTASWSSNTITISGTPNASGTFNYTIPLSGGCGTVNASGTITVNPDNTAGTPSSSPTLCINTALTDITIATTGATGIGSASGLPGGVTASWSSNTITISGTPNASGTFSYTIPLTGGCGTVDATGTITVNDLPAVDAGIDQTVCGGDNVTLNGSGASTYTWDNGVTNNTAFTASTTTTYTVTGTDANGCQNTDQVTVTVNASNTVSENGGFDVSTASYVQNFSVSAQETGPSGITFNNDGTKMFIVGYWGDEVNEYSLSTGFDVSTASYVQNFSVSAQESSPQGISFNNDGTKMFIVGYSGDDVNEYSLSTGFDVSTASYVQNFSVSAQETAPSGITFNNDGTKMFIVGYSGDDVNEYSLSTGFDVSTASYVQNFSVSAQETGPTGITFNNDGTKMFIVGYSGDDVNEYSLSTAFDVSTATYVQNFYVGAQETAPSGITFNNDGTKMFIVGYSGDDVNEYSLDNPSVQTVCQNAAIINITYNTTGATGISNDGVSGANGLPAGVSAAWSGDVITISGTPTVAGTFNYTIPLSGGCGTVNATGSIIVTGISPPTAGTITQPSCAVATGSFTIASYNAASTYTFTPSATVDGSGVVTLAAGATYTFTETNALGCISAASSNVVIDAQPSTPSAPVAGAITQPSCAVATGSFTIASYNAASTYTFTPSATVDVATGVVTLAAGATYTFTETNAVGCISSASSNVVIDAQPSTPSAPVAGAITQPSCAVATGSFTIASYNAASTYTFTPSATVDVATGVVTLAAGATYTFTETNAVGCISSASSNVVIDAQPSTPSAPVAGAITQPSCAVATGSFTIASYNAASTYTFTPSATVDVATGVVTLAAGATYTFTETNAVGCISSASSNVVIDAQPSTPSAPVAGAITQPSCAVATGSFTIASYNAASTYTFTPSATVDVATGVVTLAAGATYTFTETNAVGCISSASSNVVIDAQPSTPSAPVAGAITQPSCAVATGSFTIASYNAASTYTFTPSATVDVATGVVTLAAGATYTFTETNAVGCISSASSNVVIDAQPSTPSAPVAGAITQPSCAVATGSFTIASYNAASTYTFTPSATVDVATGVVTLAAGATYTFTETNAVGCISSASSNVVIDAQPSTPSAPVAGAITQPSCAVATGSFTIASYNAASTYTFTPSATVDVATGVVTLAAGATYTFTETNAVGCISSASSNVVIDAQPSTPSAPVAGAITQPSCAVATGSFTIASYNAASTYTFTPSATVDVATGVVTLAAGATYTFTETNAVGCISSASSNVVIDAQPSTPSAPVAGAITQPSCAVATGSFTIASYNAASTYTFTPSATVDVATGVVTLAAGATYTFTETNAVGCISAASSNVVIDAQPSTPSAPVAGAITQPSCAVATGSFTIASYNAASTYTFTPSATVDVATGVVTLAAGATYTFTETNAVGCISAASSNVVIDAQPSTPSAPVAGAITQPSCAVATGSFTIASYNAASTYTFTPSATVDVATGVVTLAAGATYTFTETNAVGCISSASSNVVIDAQPSTPSAPVAGAITQPSCAVATGSFTIASYNAASTYTFTPSATVDVATGVVTLAAGATYTFTETNAVGCISAASSNVVIDAQPSTPSAPVAGAITQPSCAVATGSFTIASYNAASTYTFTPSATVDVATGVVTLAAGATYTFTETNAVGCISAASSNVVIDAQPSTPSAPVAGAITQPSCAASNRKFYNS